MCPHSGATERDWFDQFLAGGEDGFLRLISDVHDYYGRGDVLLKDALAVPGGFVALRYMPGSSRPYIEVVRREVQHRGAWQSTAVELDALITRFSNTFWGTRMLADAPHYLAALPFLTATQNACMNANSYALNPAPIMAFMYEDGLHAALPRRQVPDRKQRARHSRLCPRQRRIADARSPCASPLSARSSHSWPVHAELVRPAYAYRKLLNPYPDVRPGLDPRLWMNGDNGVVRAFLLLLAFLLPLRVIGAESMALSMTLGAVAVAAQHAANSHQQSMEMDHSMPMEDCPLMGKAEQPPDGTDGQAQGNCQTCQICVAWATPPPLGRLPAAIPAALTSAPAEDFASAALAPDLRPPIS